MRGWERVGRVDTDRVVVVNASVVDDDLLSMSSHADGKGAGDPMFRARDVVGCRDYLWFVGDYVFRATAIGEHAFRRPSTPAPDE